MSDEYVIRVHQFTDGATGHVNIEYIKNDVSLGTYGANTDGFGVNGLQGGVFEETAKNTARIAANPAAHSYTDIRVSSVNFENSLTMAEHQQATTIFGGNDYNLVCRNCVDFADYALTSAGLGRYSIGNYLKDGTLTDIYAYLTQYLCTVDYTYVMDPYLNDNFSAPSYLSSYFQSTAGYSESWPYAITPDFLMMRNSLVNLLGPANSPISLNFEYMHFNTIESYLEAMEVAYTDHGSPIVFDLDGDGFQTTSLRSHVVQFDITGDNQAEATAWISKDDAFLAVDNNGNGIIDGVSELFGGLSRGQGYAKLSNYDTNQDGLINELDNDYDSLLVWRDSNSNGRTESGELTNLRSAGITDLSLNYVDANINANGNIIGEVSGYKINGQDRQMADIYFQYYKSTPRVLGENLDDPTPNVTNGFPELHENTNFDEWYETSKSTDVFAIDGKLIEAANLDSENWNPQLLQFDTNNQFDLTLAQDVGVDISPSANSNLASWALTSTLAGIQLVSSDTTTTGGELSYLYSNSDTLSGIGVTSALSMLPNTNLSSNPQALSSLAGLQTETACLS